MDVEKIRDSIKDDKDVLTNVEKSNANQSQN